jgi:putative hydrolase of the HAD superfamily
MTFWTLNILLNSQKPLIPSFSGTQNIVQQSIELGYRKPDRRLYDRALSRMNLSPWEVLFVGDSLYRDIYGAKRMGMKTVWFKNREKGHERRKAEPDYIIYDFRELLNAVRFFN